MSCEWINIKVNSYCGKMCFCFRGLSWLVVLFFLKSLLVLKVYEHMKKKSPLHNAKTKYIIQMSSFFLCYIFIDLCKSIIVFFFFSLSRVVLRIFFMSVSHYFLIGVGIQGQICISSLVYIYKMTVTIKSFLNHMWVIGKIHPKTCACLPGPDDLHESRY